MGAVRWSVQHKFLHLTMRHAFVIFAYPGNAAMVPYTMQAIARIHPKAHVAVAIEAGDESAYPANAHRIQTDFDRKVNLNGPAAVFGILESMLGFGRFLGADFVWKVDPDTLVLTDALFRDLEDKDIAGFQCPANRADIERPEETMLGCFYGIRTKSIPFLIAELKEWGMADNCPEDVTITRAAHGANYRRHALPVNASGPTPALFFWRWDAPLPVDRYASCAGVNFGNPGGTPEAMALLSEQMVGKHSVPLKKPSIVRRGGKAVSATPEQVEERVAIPCDQRVDGKCTACKTCSGTPTCRQVAQWRSCAKGFWQAKSAI
jgi:hypothetical protein